MLLVLFSSTLFYCCATLVYDVLYFYDNSILFYIILWKKTLQEKAQFLYPLPEALQPAMPRLAH